MQKVLYILGELSDDDIDWMIAVSQRREIPPNEVLIREGEAADALYVVLEGTLGVFIAALEGSQIAELMSGDIIGEMSFVDSRPPSATVKTTADCLILAVPHDKLEERLKLDIGFASRFYRALAVLLSNRLRGTVQTMSQQNDIAAKDETSEANLSKDMSESVALAKVRFDWLLRRLKTGKIAEN